MNVRVDNEGDTLRRSIHPYCDLYQLGLVNYADAWALQKDLMAERKKNPAQPDVLIILEHPPVYTLGQGGDLAFLKFDPTAPRHPPLHRVERGGEVTYHCPGQLVGYPILNLRRHQTDLHWYLRQLEEVIIQVLAQYQLEGQRISGLTGVWIDGCKVAAIGVKVSRWITMHGFALNVRPDLAGFQDIIPCGISDRPVGSLAQFQPNILIDQVRQDIARAFAAVFDIQLREGSDPKVSMHTDSPHEGLISPKSHQNKIITNQFPS
ncbi:MAG: lipoyl(octanoyl) transferase LipB [Leptolyngbyaceae cyanobacterium MO_188.B28]|nr:lipoyl(octanoyl) transferase LipB [Leptolyngbyaceae cyanobacterium MO_188.B28]